MKRTLIITLLCVLAVPLFAASHEITKIDFRSRVPANILRTQSALAENHSYTDEELEVAAARLRRLPFVFDVHYAIEGTTLVIDVLDEHRFFYGIDLQGETSGNHANQSSLDTGIGGRMYMQSGVFEGGAGDIAGSNETIGSVSAQYSQYGIAGTRAFATLSLRRSVGGVFGDSDLKPMLTIGAPLSINQTISFVAGHTGIRHSESFAAIPRPLRTSLVSNTFELHWAYDTTNDPFFAVRGRVLEVIPSYRRSNNLFEGFSGHTIESARYHDKETAVAVQGQQYVTLGTRTALIGGVSVRGSHLQSRIQQGDSPSLTGSQTLWKYTVSLHVARNLFNSSSRGLDSRHRLELGGSYVVEDLTPTRSIHYYVSDFGYSYRNRWGTVRLTATHSTGIFH